MENLIKKYYYKNFTHEEICSMLLKKHGLKVSVTTIKRRLATLGLKRRYIKESNIEDICYAIVEELNSAGYNLGYRSLWMKLKKKYNLVVKRDTVYYLLKIADPEGVAFRYANKLKRRTYFSPGPNFIWHLDGYDKLKPFGFAIHGCIDGYSRMILWLEVATTNNDPTVIGYYFLKTVLGLKFVPTVIRSDKGTENVLVECLQIALRMDHQDNLSGEKSFMRGKSVHNQRIESFWAQMRHHSADFFIYLFKSMIEKGLFNGSDLHKKCLQFCFGPLIKAELDSTRKLWNEHRIRKQGGIHIAGRPYLLFNVPEKYHAQDCKKDVDEKVIQQLIFQFTKEPQLYNAEIQELVDSILPYAGIASTPEEALLLYQNLLQGINEHERQ